MFKWILLTIHVTITLMVSEGFDWRLYEVFEYERTILSIKEPHQLRYEPKDFDRSKVNFYLYVRNDTDIGSHINLGDLSSVQYFDPQLPTKIIIHGFNTDYLGDTTQLIKRAYLDVGYYNVIGVDWGPYNNPYWTSVAMSRPTGGYIGELLQFLIESRGLSLSNVHLIGHSLGAHIAGYVADYFPERKIKRITALDPAAPGFENKPPEVIVDATDAEFVDVIHTSIRLLGLERNIGTVDFYPAGGKFQPDCVPSINNELTGICDHSQSVKYFANSIRNNFLYTGAKCNSLHDALNKNCNGPPGVMGEAAPGSEPGVYYVNVKKSIYYN